MINFASLCWGSGYIGMWCMKWGLASMILQENIFNNAIAQFLLRSSLFINGDASENILYKDVLLKILVYLERKCLFCFFLL